MGIDQVAAELEIRNVLARLAQLADAGDLDGYLALLTGDIVWAMPASPHVGLTASERRGRDEIARGARERTTAGLQGPGSDTMHTVTTTSIRVDGPDEATALSSFVFWTTTSTTPTPTSVGRYEDTFRSTDEGWKLARRTVIFG